MPFQIITACPREVVARGGHPLGLIEYMLERVCQGFLPFELHKFVIFWNLHQPKGLPTSHFHQPKGFKGVPTSHFSSTQRFLGGARLSLSSTQRFLGGAHLSLFINAKVFRGFPPLTFHQPKGF